MNGRALIRAQTCTRTYIDANTNNKTHKQTHALALAHTHWNVKHDADAPGDAHDDYAQRRTGSGVSDNVGVTISISTSISRV